MMPLVNRIGHAAACLPQDRIVPPTAPVYRDPCPRCGVRGDVRCGHTASRLIVRERALPATAGGRW